MLLPTSVFFYIKMLNSELKSRKNNKSFYKISSRLDFYIRFIHSFFRVQMLKWMDSFKILSRDRKACYGGWKFRLFFFIIRVPNWKIEVIPYLRNWKAFFSFFYITVLPFITDPELKQWFLPLNLNVVEFRTSTVDNVCISLICICCICCLQQLRN